MADNRLQDLWEGERMTEQLRELCHECGAPAVAYRTYWDDGGLVFPVCAADSDDPLIANEPEYDQQMKSFIIKRVGRWIVSVTPMIFNDRVILTHEEDYPVFYTSGYCYDKGGAAYLAARVWDPTVDMRPVGFRKIACEDTLHWAIKRV